MTERYYGARRINGPENILGSWGGRSILWPYKECPNSFGSTLHFFLCIKCSISLLGGGGAIFLLDAHGMAKLILRTIVTDIYCNVNSLSLKLFL